MSIHSLLLTQGDQEQTTWSPKGDENTMSPKIRPYFKFISAIRPYMIILILILACGVTTGFIWLQMDQVIAPPGLRLVDWFWRMFVI